MDLNAGLHGNWTLENAKARLNQFFQKEKMTSEYKYSQVGPDHNRSAGHGVATPQRTVSFKENVYCYGAVRFKSCYLSVIG